MSNKVRLTRAYSDGRAYLEFEGDKYVRDTNVAGVPRIRKGEQDDMNHVWELTGKRKPNVFFRDDSEFVDFKEADSVIETSQLMHRLAGIGLCTAVFNTEGPEYADLVRKFQGMINERDLSYFAGIPTFEQFKPALSIEPPEFPRFMSRLTHN